MRWTKRLPTKPGIYLRNNPGAFQVVRQDMTLIEGDLCTCGSEGYTIRLKQWGGAKTMWWFGPIPQPPRLED